MEEQIIAVLREHEAGAKAADLCRKYGMSAKTSRAAVPASARSDCRDRTGDAGKICRNLA